ncbi:uncharacterized protein MELLADRAFT_87505 [Melampsora larici-populina 98AG31]|uniref:RING-type domain-containing protein n=1 Tax=Melampsora larici-populina (strain 98AG31 / pathotype 3-4-7) TaxID=747676 RepID=F4RNK6_MELLP|nr:uncharacterized protein MELLADRAFT_87505 [Melampsora larici-populina 98AG31]EGG06078.1 hypothetical protein MELLADRAFT_87505 [Melampsora larici-populina 98AG31]
MAKSSNSIEPWNAIEPQAFESSDDEDLCPLCMEELDVSDLNFRPCPCGYRICRFCWHHIKEDLNRRCPGCRKEYDDSVVEFKPMKAEELKRLQQAKKQRDKDRKDLELVNRKHLANVRVKQKNQVHVQGLTTKIANEDTLAQLKTSEMFSQYGRILKMFMSRRTGPTNLYTPDSRYQHVNLYINFSKNTEALACIQGLDGTSLPDGHRLKASLGSTKYCASFLRGLKCINDNCTAAHELAEEVEGGGSAAREEMSTAYLSPSIFTFPGIPIANPPEPISRRHAQKESEHRISPKNHISHALHPSSSTPANPLASGVALPATASWANKSSSNSRPASPAPHLLSLQNQAQHSSPSAKLMLRGTTSTALKPTHPLPPKPRHNSPYGAKVKSTSEEPNSTGKPLSGLHSNEAGTNNKSFRPTSDSQADDPHHQRMADEKDTQKPDEVSPTNVTFTTTTPHPPGLPPPGLNGLPPPGLTASSAGTSPATRVPTSLPPGLTPPQPVDFASSSWHGAFDVTVALEPKFAQTSLRTSTGKDDKIDILSTFSPNFTLTSRSSIFDPSDDPFYCVPDPTIPTSYSGSFNPFADTDINPPDRMAGGESQGKIGDGRSDEPLIARRGSRFGFARRESGLTTGLTVEGPSSSPLRSIFSSNSADGGGPSGQNNLSNSARSAMTVGRSDGSVHLASNTPGESTPDASVLFPGVNLAASYSANALPAALARGMKSPGSTPSRPSTNTPPVSFQSLTPSTHLRDAMIASYDRPNDRLPPAFNPRATATSPTYPHTHLSNHHEDLLRGEHTRDRRVDVTPGAFNMSSQYSMGNGDMGHEFQDPAILNMRMASNANGAYAPPLLPSSSSSHSVNDLYPQFNMNAAGFHNVMSSGRPHFPQTQTNQDLLNHYGFPGVHPLANAPNNRVQSHTYYNVSTIGSQGLMSGNAQRDIDDGIKD